jgi:putative oxidoreductase
MKNKILIYQSFNADTACLLLRIIFGGLFIYHGYTKLLSFDEIAPVFKDYIGIGSRLSLILVIFAELGCGFLVAIGFLTRLSVIPIFITMLVAFFMAHAGDPFQEKVLPFVYLLLSVVIFLSGGGKYSIDKLVFKKRHLFGTPDYQRQIPAAL